MTVTDRYWLRVNKKNIIIDVFAVIIFCILNMFATLALVYYSARIIAYSSKFLNMDGLNPDESNRLNQILIMPFSREEIYKTYIKMMSILTAVFVVMFGAGRIICYLGGSFITVSSGGQAYSAGNVFTNMGYYMLCLAFLNLALIFVVRLINSFKVSTVFTIVFMGFCTLILIPAINYSIIISSKTYIAVQFIYLAFSLLLSVILFVVLIRNIKKSYNLFVLKHRRYIHVNEDL